MKSELPFKADKSQLRKSMRCKRKLISNKASSDMAIQQTLISMKEFASSESILFYFSLDDEVSTEFAIQYSLEHGKKVALPCCVDNCGLMEFYYINSIQDLKVGHFGVKEPDICKCEKVSVFDDALIVVPAICFDKQGYRLGYGKGYYDRFLQKHSLISVGLCYNSLIVDELPIDKYDQNVSVLITENTITRIDGGFYGRF